MTSNILCKAYGHNDQPPVPTGDIKKVQGVVKQKYTIECARCYREKVSWDGRRIMTQFENNVHGEVEG